MALSIDLNDDEQQRIASVVARTGRTAEELVHEAIAMHLDEVEETAWAERVTQAWRASDQKTRPISEIRRELGL